MNATAMIGLTVEQTTFFRANGFLAVSQLLAPDEAAEIRDCFMDLTKDGPVPGLSEIRTEYNANDPLSRWPRVMHPHRHLDKPCGAISMKYMLHPRLRPILRELMGEDPLAVQSMFYFKPPGSRGQDLHQDNFYLRVKPGTCMAAWLAIDDADAENGGMMCVPGTANLDVACPERADPDKFFTTEHVEPPPGKSPQLVPLKAGDVLFFNGSVIHGSYPNTSKTRFRRSLIFHYVPRSTAELSRWYEKPLSFDHQLHEIPPATGGGPCGTPQATEAVH